MALEAKFVIVPRGSVLNACLDSKKSKFWPYDDQLNKSDKISLDTRDLAVYFKLPQNF